MLYREIMAVCSEIHRNTVCGQNIELLKIRLVVHIVTTGYKELNPCYKNQSVLHRKIISVSSEIHTKHINVLCEQKVELLNVYFAVHIVTTGGTYSDHWVLKY